MPGTRGTRPNKGPDHCNIFKTEPQKPYFYKDIIRFCPENILWSGSRMEQMRGILHLFDVSNFDLSAFQILVIYLGSLGNKIVYCVSCHSDFSPLIQIDLSPL